MKCMCYSSNSLHTHRHYRPRHDINKPYEEEEAIGCYSTKSYLNMLQIETTTMWGGGFCMH